MPATKGQAAALGAGEVRLVPVQPGGVDRQVDRTRTNSWSRAQAGSPNAAAANLLTGQPHG